MTKEIDTTDMELESLMAELETQNDAIMAKQAATQPTKEPEPEPEPEVDLTRAIVIHNAAAKKVRKGTVADLADGDEEVETADGIALAKKYKTEKVPTALPWEDESTASTASTASCRIL